MSSKIIALDGVVTRLGTTLFGRTVEAPRVTVLTGTFEPWDRTLQLPVPAGTLKLMTSPTVWTLRVVAGSTGVRGGTTCEALHVAGGARGESTGPPSTTFGVPGGVHAGEPVGERHAPFTQAVSGAPQFPGPLHEGKQNEPVEVLTHLPFAGQVVWSAGLHAAVQAPPGNSGFGSPTQVSPAPVHPAPQAMPRSALAGRCWGGQLAAGTQAPNPAQQV